MIKDLRNDACYNCKYFTQAKGIYLCKRYPPQNNRFCSLSETLVNMYHRKLNEVDVKDLRDTVCGEFIDISQEKFMRFAKFPIDDFSENINRLLQENGFMTWNDILCLDNLSPISAIKGIGYKTIREIIDILWEYFKIDMDFGIPHPK